MCFDIVVAVSCHTQFIFAIFEPKDYKKAVAEIIQIYFYALC